ncbi:MAG: hypothetical protein M3P18_08810 [Actinomycetota bacterium]|nr:hypothetical protein [Actinomycetota bacterium]
MAPRLEIAATSVVLAGSFNPPIFQPRWFEVNELLGPEHAREAEKNLRALGNDLLAFVVEWLELQVTPDTCIVVTNDSTRESDLRDLVAGAFSLLGHTPLGALGLNRLVHYQYTEAEDYDRVVNDYLTTTKPWDFLEAPEATGVRMRSPRGEEPKPGVTNVEIAPSVRIPSLGLFVAVNDHYDWSVDGEMAVAEDLPGILDKEWDVARNRANSIISQIVNA